MYKKGDVVKLKAAVPQGPIGSMRMDEDGTVWCMLEWTGDDGQVHSRWFKADDVEPAE
jgi:sugar lactone lactonase YvrE